MQVIRKAKREEAGVLTEISFASKRYWRYPEKYIDVWRDELTITNCYVINNDVYVLENNQQIVGYYSLLNIKEDKELGGVILPGGTWLEHMFIVPSYIRRSFGTELFSHAHKVCKNKGVNILYILSDPHAAGFYQKMGCSYVLEFPSTIAGRTTPLLTFDIICGAK